MLSYGVWHDSWNPSCGISEMVSFAGSDFDDMQNCCQFWKTKEMEFIHSKYLYNWLIQGLFSIISILSAIIEYEHTVIIPEGYSTQSIHTNKDDSSVIQLYSINPNYFKNCQNCSKISSYVSLVASVFLWVTIFFDFVLSHQIYFYESTKDYHSFFKHSETIIWLIITLIIFIPCPNPTIIQVREWASW